MTTTDADASQGSDLDTGGDTREDAGGDTGLNAAPQVDAERLATAREAADVAPGTPLDDEHLRALSLVGTIELGAALTEGMAATLQRIVDVLDPNLSDVRGVSVILWSAVEGRFTTSASTVPEQSSAEASRRVRRGGVTSWIVDHAVPLVVNDVDEDPFGANDMLREYGAWSYVGVPIKDGSGAIGVLYAMAGRRDRFGPADVRFLTTIADRCSVVLRTARANERTMDLLARAEGLRAVTATLASMEPFTDRLTEVTERLARVLRGGVAVTVTTPDGTDTRDCQSPATGRRHDERTHTAVAAVDDVDVEIRLSPGRSSPAEREVADVLTSVAEQIGLAAAREQAAAALLASNQALEQFAHVASHDLKSPLASVIGFVDLALTTGDDDMSDRHRDLLERALRGGHRMGEIIDALLGYAKLQSAEHLPEPTPLADLVGQVLGDLVATIDASDANVVVSTSLPIVDVDPTAFRIVLQNLVANALKFVRPDEAPEVHIAAEVSEDDAIRIVIEDDGIGIPEAERERVFELFHRASARHRGSGIGLATVRRIVERHRGTVWLEARPTGGTRAVVSLPAPRRREVSGTPR